MSNDLAKKPMATATNSPAFAIDHDLKVGLAELPAVRSVYSLYSDNVFSVWVDISQDEQEVRAAVYRFEDAIADRYTQVLFDFHVIPVPQGRKIEEFVSGAHPIFNRSIA